MVKWFSPTDIDNACTILDSNSNKTYTLELHYLELSDTPHSKLFYWACSSTTVKMCTAHTAAVHSNFFSSW